MRSLAFPQSPLLQKTEVFCDENSSHANRRGNREDGRARQVQAERIAPGTLVRHRRWRLKV